MSKAIICTFEERKKQFNTLDGYSWTTLIKRIVINPLYSCYALEYIAANQPKICQDSRMQLCKETTIAIGMER